MRSTTHLRVGLALGLITVVGAAVGMAFWALAHPTTSPGTGAAALDAALTVALAWLGCLLTVWLTAAGALAPLAQLHRPWAAKARAGADWLAPAAVRRFAALLVGATIASAAAPVTAVGQEPHRDRTTISALARAPEPSLLIADDLAGPDPSLVGSDPAAAPDAGWLPTRPPALPAGDADLLHRAPRPSLIAAESARPTQVTVRRGDTLWHIAARHLGPHASATEIAAAWPRWYAANRAVIGDDPDAIYPGQLLNEPQEGPS